MSSLREIFWCFREKQQPSSGQQGWKGAYEHEKIPRMEKETAVRFDVHVQRNNNPADAWNFQTVCNVEQILRKKRRQSEIFKGSCFRTFIPNKNYLRFIIIKIVIVRLLSLKLNVRHLHYTSIKTDFNRKFNTSISLLNLLKIYKRNIYTSR